jgi:hypothetical protein
MNLVATVEVTLAHLYGTGKHNDGRVTADLKTGL